MRFFAIRKRGTQKFLPVLPANYRAGYTWTEPTDELPPRLYKSATGAKIGLRMWLSGGMKKDWGTTSGFSFGMDPPEPSESIEIVKKPERKAEDMEIVPVVLLCRPALPAKMEA